MKISIFVSKALKRVKTVYIYKFEIEIVRNSIQQLQKKITFFTFIGRNNNVSKVGNF